MPVESVHKRSHCIVIFTYKWSQHSFLFTPNPEFQAIWHLNIQTMIKLHTRAVVYENNSVVYTGLHLNWQMLVSGTQFFYINRFPQSLFN